MSLCQSIDTLAMAFLDDELVAEERRELELHLLSCESCRQHVEGERADLSLIRKALVAPPAPGALRVSIQRALDAEDLDAARAVRRRSITFVGRWLLPGAATLAAAAAIAVFAFVPPPEVAPATTTVAREAVRQQGLSLPLEVQGASTAPWLRQHFAPISPPVFTEPNVELLGARLTAIAGHDAALLKYGVAVGNNRFTLSAVVIDSLREGELEGGQPIKIGDRTLHVHDADGVPAVTYVDESGPPGSRIGYTFACQRLSAHELIELVVSSDLITRVQQGR